MVFLIRKATPGPDIWCGISVYVGANPAVHASTCGKSGWNSCSAIMSAPNGKTEDKILAQRSTVIPAAPCMLKEANTAPGEALGFWLNW